LIFFIKGLEKFWQYDVFITITLNKFAKTGGLMTTDEQIKNEMYFLYQDYLDDSNCLNTTFLAETVADHFGENPEDGSDIDERYFDIAQEVSSELYDAGLVNI
jgi:hypothetical protein